MRSFYLFLPLLLLFMITACSEKKESYEDNKSKISEAIESNQSTQSFLLKDIDERELNITASGKDFQFDNIDQELVLINLFATWCPPCKGELPDLSRLQRKYAKELFVVGILVNDETNSTQLRAFMEKYGANYYISYTNANSALAEKITKNLGLPENYPIPLSILYVNGKLFRYYEGAMPIEMMENELKKALKKQGS